MNYDLSKTEAELKKRLSYPYRWGRMQNDYFDRLTDFIYRISEFNAVINEIEKRFSNDKNHKNVANYALNRWYNFWSAQAMEMIFCSLPDVIPALDEKDRLVDFTIRGISSDLKTTIYPEKYPHSIEEALKNKAELIKWLYINQSRQKRKHFKNRIFIVLYSSDGEHWKLKSEISWLKEIIENYVAKFDPENLIEFSFLKEEKTLSDIIWAIKN